ncbi:hypothetical protein [Georgenia sp. Z1491]|uniref:hypothetical protein n=1 Tax=Georgenia sp. Z1491 TaxID=3416707 RepID=UPI003CEB4D64
MTDAAALARKLQAKPGATVWTWPESDDLPEALRGAHEVVPGPVTEADVAVLLTEDRAAVDTVLADHLEELTDVGAVWIVYAKGNRTDVNRDTLWVQLAEYGWRAVSQVSWSDTRSALRVRPLREGEVPRTA